jgi:hypothetical protein
MIACACTFALTFLILVRFVVNNQAMKQQDRFARVRERSWQNSIATDHASGIQLENVNKLGSARAR